jgi:hypothetical protein
MLLADYPSDYPEYEIPASESARTRAHRVAFAYITQRRLRPAPQLIAGALGVAASVALHALFIGSFLWGWAAVHAKRPDDQGVGASATDSNQEPVMTMILISESQAAKKTSDPGELPSRGLAPEDPKVRVLSPDPFPSIDLTLADGDTALQSPEAHDAAERAMLFGRYMGQINARIERAWLRPRTAIGGTLFECQVSIAQDRSGNVTEVTLQQCNGDALWQQSLVSAIQSASPLPAPPDPDVFSSTLTSRFESAAYVSGGKSEGFEPSLRIASVEIVPPIKAIAVQLSPIISSASSKASR